MRLLQRTTAQWSRTYGKWSIFDTSSPSNLPEAYHFTNQAPVQLPLAPLECLVTTLTLLPMKYICLRSSKGPLLTCCAMFSTADCFHSSACLLTLAGPDLARSLSMSSCKYLLYKGWKVSLLTNRYPSMSIDEAASFLISFSFHCIHFLYDMLGSLRIYCVTIRYASGDESGKTEQENKKGWICIHPHLANLIALQ